MLYIRMLWPIKTKIMRIIITVLTIVISIPTFGQNHFFGLKGGINWTNVNSSNFISGNDNRTGFNGGLTYQYFLNERFNLGTELLYFQRGFVNDIVFTNEFGNPTGERATNTLDYDYLSIPLKGGIRIGDKFSGFANLGIVPSFLLDAKTTTPAIEGFQEETTYNVTDRVTKFDLGGLVEIGANYKITPDFLLSTSFGYQHSFTSITNDDYFSNTEARHYGMVLSIGLKYALKKE
jgi:hypothetical protein